MMLFAGPTPALWESSASKPWDWDPPSSKNSAHVRWWAISESELYSARQTLTNTISYNFIQPKKKI